MENEESKATVEKEVVQEWKESMHQSIVDALQNSLLADGPILFSPVFFSEGYDERMFHELSQSERQFVEVTFFNELGFDRNHTEIVGNYTYESTDEESLQGISHVKILRTQRSDRGMYLHEISRPDNTKEYMVAPEAFRL